MGLACASTNLPFGPVARGVQRPLAEEGPHRVRGHYGAVNVVRRELGLEHRTMWLVALRLNAGRNLCRHEPGSTRAGNIRTPFSGPQGAVLLRAAVCVQRSEPRNACWCTCSHRPSTSATMLHRRPAPSSRCRVDTGLGDGNLLSEGRTTAGSAVALPNFALQNLGMAGPK